jgi:ribose transport system substrate-binding protein
MSVGAVVVAGSLALAGCTAATSTGGSTKKSITIGVAQASTTNSFLAALDNAIIAQDKKYGYKTKILNGNFDNATQAANVATLTADKVDAEIVVSSSPTAVVANIAKARAAGIPVFAVNAQLDPTAKIVTYVGDSDYDYGVGEGNLLVKALPKGGKAAIILGPIGDTPEVQRLAGIKSVLASHSNITIVDTPSDGFDNAKDLAAVQNLLSKYPAGSLDAVVAEGPQIYVGAQYAFQHGRKDIKFIAGDYPTQVEAAIKAGQIYGTVNQSPILEGQLGAQYAHLWLTGQKSKIPTPKYLIPLPAITAANVGSSPSSWSN